MMADWRSMQPAATQSWVSGDFQMADDWTMKPAAAQVWLPGPPVEYQFAPLATSGKQQLVVQYAAAASEVEHTIIHDEVAVKIHDDAIHVFKEANQVFDSDIKKMKVKMHRYPRSIINQYLDERHSVPSTVAIGPYHHGLARLQEAEKVKHVTAYHCIKQSGRSVQDMYDAIVLDTDYARSLYDKNMVVGISDDDFRPMMFYDACFLVQYMLSCTLHGYDNMDESLRNYFDSNDETIFNDLMMLENQLPWKVVETLMKFVEVPLEAVASYARTFLQTTMHPFNQEDVALDDTYTPPHLLGFLRFYMVGRGTGSNIDDKDTKDSDPPETISISVSAIELAEMGIEIKVRKRVDLKDIGIEEGHHNLFIPPVILKDSIACILVNMAAFELCTIPDFHGEDATEEDSAVCSYLQLLAMVIDKKEDVQELRRRKVLLGGGGLTDDQVIFFFNSLQDMRLGSRYFSTMLKIDNYKLHNKIRVRRKTFWYKHKATIIKVLSGMATLAGVLGTLASLKV